MTTSSPPWLPELLGATQGVGVDVITATDPRYSDGRHVYNRLHDARPAALVRTLERNALARVFDVARKYGVEIAVRGGGHHVAGFGTTDGGIVIDMSVFRGVTIGPRFIEVQPGARLGDLDRALVPEGMVVPTGTVSDTGVAGLTLGGGIGWLVGQFGLACDHLIGADFLTADGVLLRAEDPENEDLLWALRGGGTPSGIVTSFRFEPRKLPLITTGFAVVAMSSAEAALARLLPLLADCPRSLTVAPCFRSSKESGPKLNVEFCMCGTNVEPLDWLRSCVRSAEWTVTGNDDFIRWQAAADAAFQPPMRGYWKARYLSAESAVDVGYLCEAFANAPAARGSMLIEHLHGAFTDGSTLSSAFPLRHARIGILASARWPERGEDQACMSWVRSTIRGVDPADCGSAYSNYSLADDKCVRRTFAAPAQARFSALKNRYDPGNLFRRGHDGCVWA